MKNKYLLLSSRQNPLIKQILRLRERRERDQTDRFLIEGYRELLHAVSAGQLVEHLFICPNFFLGTNEEELIDQIAHHAAIYTVTPDLFQKISYRDRPDGLLGIALQSHLALEQLKRSKNPLFVVAEAIEKPGNLGTILRSCDAAGCHGMILCDRCTDLFNPNVVRASVGTLFTVPVVETRGEAALKWLKKHQIKIVAATPQAEHCYTDVDLTGPIAIAVGTEQLGLSQLWLDQAELQVKIPMLGAADSLNVAIATSLILYEAVRQRHG